MRTAGRPGPSPRPAWGSPWGSLRLLVAGLALLAAAASPAVGSAEPPARTVTVDIGASDPAVSPDGRTIAVSVLGSIFLVPVEGGAAERVSHGPTWDTSPSWSPDGRRLAWARRSPSGTDLVVLERTGGTLRFVHRVDRGIGRIAFHPSGGELFFVLDRNQYDAHVWRVPAAGGEAERLTATEDWHEWSFALSPDGERMLLESGQWGGSDLYEMELTGDRPVERLTETYAVHEHQVAWAPDGRRVWIARRDGVDRLTVREPDGATRVVSESPYDQKTLALTPSGDAVILAAGRRLRRVDLSTGTETPIAFTATFELPDRSPGDLVVTNARLFTGTSDGYLEGATVVVREGRIAAVHEGPAPGTPDGIRIVDAGGRVVMSGLTDNHYHFWNPFAGQALLARGVTAVRDPGVAPSTSLDFRDALRIGIVPGPELYTAGPLIDGPGGYHPAVDVALETPAAAAPLVRSLKAQGVDALKVYFLLEPDVLAAVVEEARAQGLPVTGHIGVRTSWAEALDAGIDGFSHIRVWRDFLPPELQPTGEGQSLASSRNPVARMQADWSLIDPDGPEVGRLLARMAADGVAMDPTLAIQRIGEGHRERLSLEEFQTARESYDEMERFLVRAFEAGVPILAGTDNISIVRELEAYREAGIPPADVLRAATVNGARWLGRGDEFGTVEAGREADLIVVDGDPLEDVGDLERITHVIEDGRVVLETAVPERDGGG